VARQLFMYKRSGILFQSITFEHITCP